MKETGIGIPNPLFFIGVVENNVDRRLEGRVQVRAFGIHGTVDQIPTAQLPWATLIIGSHDTNFVVPPVNSWVFGLFIDGREAQQPMILGLIPTQMTEPVDPANTGWGNPLGTDIDVNAQGSRPQDFGQPQNSRLARGEELQNTYILPMDVNRIRNIDIAGGSANIASGGNNGVTSQDHGQTNRSGGPIPQSGVNYANSNLTSEIPENIRPLMTAIGQAESISSGGYNAFNRGTSGDVIVGSGSTDLSSLTVGEILRRGKLGSSNPDKLFAVGYYQIVADQKTGTLQSLVNQGFVSTNERFTPNVQDRLGMALLERRGLSKYLNGSLSQEQFAYNLSGEWAGLPDPYTNKSRYGSGNTANVSTNSVFEALDVAKDGNADTSNTLPSDTSDTSNTLPTDTSAEEQISASDNDTDMSWSPQTVWEEPSPAYHAVYPYNRVIETGSGHSIEIDDTQGAERIMIWHKDGSYIQLAPGSTAYKSTRDTYDINERNHHVYIGGTNIVTIEGDSHVLVKGNKIEEIRGDYKQIIHGSHEVGVAGQMNFNGGDGGQIRAAQLTFESNVENLNIKVGKSLKLQSGENIHIKTNQLFLEGSESISIKSATLNVKADNVLISASEDFNLKTDNMFMQATATGEFKANSIKIGGGATSSINSTNVYIDDVISMANGSPISFAGPTESDDFDVLDAAPVERPEPPDKNIAPQQNNTAFA